MLMNINKKTQFWIYPLSEKSNGELLKHKYLNIGFSECLPLVKGDIVIVFVKAKGVGGFSAILQLGKNPAKTNVKVFKDANMNKYTSPVSEKNIFLKPIRISTIMSQIKADIPGYRTATSFAMKYMKQVHKVTKIEVGQKIINALLSQDQVNIEEEKKKEAEAEKEEEELKNQDSEEEQKSEPKDQDSEEEQVDFYRVPEGLGYIPIMIIPCEKFCLPTKGRCDYIIDHYKECNRCSVTNNNNLELCAIIDDAYIEVMI